MLPSVVAHELQLALHDYLRAAFPMSSPLFREEGRRGEGAKGETALIDRFLAEPGKLFKGPYLSLGLPFRRDDARPPFQYLQLDFPPYRHQQRAFTRLCGEPKHSTLIATGTGSGKTEGFLLPILEHCLAVRHDPAIANKRGIKALIIYPMNALATDQARRFAKEIHKLDTRLTVGLFTGDQQEEPSRRMSADSVITCKDTLRDNPPDILLTNYKMLDFLLLRPGDQPLWRFNTPGMLRYLVVDELHTFDGAQGTDLACLIRRLRERLGAGSELACVGTSATIGGEDAAASLCRYAEQIFATPFATDSLILEDRLSAEEYLAQAKEQLGEIAFTHWPSDPAALKQLDPQRYDQRTAYLEGVYRQWFEGEDPALLETDPLALGNAQHTEHAAALVALGRDLRRHQGFHRLLPEVDGVTDLAELTRRWESHLRLSGQAGLFVYSLVALISAARDSVTLNDGTRITTPLLNVRNQLWLREMRRLVASVAPRPALTHADDLSDEEGPLHLPLVHCRECHATAWGATKKPEDIRLSADLSLFYKRYFAASPDVCLLYPLGDETEPPGSEGALIRQLCGACGALPNGTRDTCPQCDHDTLLRVWQPALNVRTEEGIKARTDHCPWCQSHNGLAIVGFRAASLSSALLSRLYQSPYNDHRKTIAFSDSVQDAAHRAGFFEARTWSQGLRQVLDQFISAQGQGLPLEALGQRFATWLRETTGNDEDFVGRWVAPNMHWLRDVDTLATRGALPAGSNLVELVSKRLEWEVLSELGLRSQIGRTLERQGRVSLEVDSDLLESAAQRLARDWQQELAGIGTVDSRQARRFLLGVLHRLRVRGAFLHPFVEEYVKSGGKTYLFNRIPYMPGYGPRFPGPAFLALQPAGTSFDSVTGSRSRWYADWFLKQLDVEQVMAASDIQQAYVLALRALESAGLVRSHTVRQHAVWGLTRPHWQATTQLQALRCDRCGQRHHVPSGQLMDWQQMPCLQPHCNGRFGLAEKTHWALTPSRSAPSRLVSHEHTGLLDADTRAFVERSFIHGERPWDINLLSATPTLEMGIDIGDLSSVLLCSTPPAQANYLQRIGRAGRRDGNALNVTIANAAPHDLFFYEDPMEMMAGSVQTPGVFLKATAVLERQLIAYCFDHWVAAADRHGELGPGMLPGRLSQVLDNIATERRDGFPYPLLDYITHHQEALLNGFCALFPELDAEAHDHLGAFIAGGDAAGLGHRILNRLHEKVRQRDSWHATVRELKNRLDQLRKAPDDEATREAIESITAERQAQMQLARRLNAQHTLNFFTDEGLLPNYAFPEEGVTLNGVILRSVSRRQQESTGKAYEVVNYEFQRPAQSALVELAPENTFYAVGHALKIDQVNIKLNEVETWRLCNHCHYSESVADGDRHGACPRCGSPQWADGAQKRSMLRLREVTANVRDRDSRIGDEAEQREPSFYTRQMLTDIAPGSARFAYRIDDPACPFGFEYVPRASFREINFGRHDEQAASLTVAGQEAPRAGFRLCRHCGKVQYVGQQERDRHQRFCKLARAGAVESEDDYLDSLFLYRELTSEAVRLLLPLSDVAMSDEARHSLIAAIQLGLKSYFHGDVGHLRMTEQQAPGTDNGPSRHFLVLYDSVPGGTGYLKELMQSPAHLMEMLGEAHRILADCGCQDQPHRDGCYRCLLAYRESRHMPVISRRLAMDLLGRILERRDQLVEIDGLDKVDINTLVESELEQRFIDMLPSLAPDMRLVSELVDGMPGWRLTLRCGDDALRSWLIEPQRKLGASDHVSRATQPDFVLWPTGNAHRDVLPVALYLDGFQYHYAISDDDTAKRQAVLASGGFRIWSLGWRDLENRAEPLDQPLWEAMAPGRLDAQYAKIADKLGLVSQFDSHKALRESSLAWLLGYLRDPQGTARHLGLSGVAQAFHWLDARTRKDPALVQAIDLELQENAPPAIRRTLLPEGSSPLLGGVMHALGNNDGTSEVTVSIELDALMNARRLLSELHVHLSLDDRETSDSRDAETAWRRFWHAANLLQFLPRFSMASVRGVARQHTCESLATHPLHSTDTAQEDDDAWAEVTEMTLLPPEWIREMRQHGLPCPTPGLEWLDAQGEASIVLELAWEDARVAVVIEEEQPAGWREQLDAWRLITDRDGASAIERLVGWLQPATETQGADHE